MSVSTLKQIFDQKLAETETATTPTTTILTNSPTKSKLLVANVQQSSTVLVQQKFVVNNINNNNGSSNNASRLKNNQQQQQSLIKNSFDKDSSCYKRVYSAHTNKNEDNSVSHHQLARYNKMVAKQEIVLEPDVQNENEEDFKYGPGFVSKLRYRYLSLTLRQSSVSKQRPSILDLRRSTSLNNLLDEDCEEDMEHEEEEEEVADMKTINVMNCNNKDFVYHENLKNNNRNGIDKLKTLTESYPAPEHQTQYSVRSSRSIDKNLNLKRARSVEAILRYDHSAWERDIQKDHQQQPHRQSTGSETTATVKNSNDVTIEEKINSAKERPYNMPPKRLTSLIGDDERPPPGICKQTMRIFEASANKKRNSQNRPIGESIASRMAMFKSQSQEKPAITAKKPNIIPRTSSPKPINHLNQVNNHNNSNMPNNAMNNSEKFAKYTKEKTVLPKLDINIIKNNLETKSNGSSSGGNGSWSPIENKDSYRVKRDYSPVNSDSSLSSTPNILSPFRNSMSPQLIEPGYNKKTVTGSTTVDTSSPIITSLSSKLSNLHMDNTSTPKTTHKNNNLLKTIDDSEIDVSSSDKESSDNKFNNNVIVEVKGSELKSVNDELSVESKTVNNSSKIINNNSLTTTPSTAISSQKVVVNHEKSVTSEINNGEVKSVKENFMITKPTTKPPPPPIITSNSSTIVTMKSQGGADKSSLNTENENGSGAKWTVKKKSWSSQADDQPSNSIVFNFSDRKDVPDYIEHDGLILRRKRELPKPNESGFVLLGDLTLDSSTDPDDAYHMGPPSPCDVEFENANIIPEGKSSIRTRTKEVKFKIQFDDSLTATYEYPSETSLMIDETFGDDDDEVDANFYGRASSSKLLTSVPLGSTPFANYQPQKANAASFELGITRTTPSPSSASSEENTFISNPDEDVDDYLKPATDAESHRWSSEETRGTDLLF
ncbi:hypothetical protein PVAND_010165 [Polypedilum vanderplanki]|uniref:Uncharacterized protein n=1 Tax=Polypedilum vanderplanki TaxID=319348 RepID=A0A9J6CFI8_POLVA|nr:hypothetical protein PVAND_010165 [Polypedilum vanderplanki]